jgi:alkylhydroperoxidase/carboxymuconolactone decarboxylase family protein YurZ
MLNLDDIEAIALQMLEGAPDGDELSAEAASLVDLAVKVSVTSLDRTAIEQAIGAARERGVSTDQIQEIIALVSGLGVHSLMMSSTAVLASAGDMPPLDDEREALWARYVGSDPYWLDFERETPGFLDALLQLSPASFKGFFDYCAIPWMTRSVPALTKELAALACDACPSHRFGPGLRHHLRGALKLGAGRTMILKTLAMAASAPVHSGIA